MTIKKKRTVVSALVALFATAAMTLTASAYTYSFNFTLDAKEQAYTAACKKLNSNRYASVDVDGGNFIAGSDELYFRVCENYKADNYIYEFAGETKWVDGVYNFNLNYYANHGYLNTYYRLRGYSDGEYDNLNAYGTWQP